jgi:hypothetical protein
MSVQNVAVHVLYCKVHLVHCRSSVVPALADIRRCPGAWRAGAAVAGPKPAAAREETVEIVVRKGQKMWIGSCLSDCDAHGLAQCGQGQYCSCLQGQQVRVVLHRQETLAAVHPLWTRSLHINVLGGMSAKITAAELVELLGQGFLI